MGQRLSCGQHHENGLFTAIADGELEVVEAMVKEDYTVLEETTGHAKLSPLHVAAANGRIEVVFLFFVVTLASFQSWDFDTYFRALNFDHFIWFDLEQVLCMLLDRIANVDILNRFKQVLF